LRLRPTLACSAMGASPGYDRAGAPRLPRYRSVPLAIGADGLCAWVGSGVVRFDARSLRVHGCTSSRFRRSPSALRRHTGRFGFEAEVKPRGAADSRYTASDSCALPPLYPDLESVHTVTDAAIAWLPDRFPGARPGRCPTAPTVERRHSFGGAVAALRHRPVTGRNGRNGGDPVAFPRQACGTAVPVGTNYPVRSSGPQLSCPKPSTSSVARSATDGSTSAITSQSVIRGPLSGPRPHSRPITIHGRVPEPRTPSKWR
jgi:hypothetical protein